MRRRCATRVADGWSCLEIAERRRGLPSPRSWYDETTNTFRLDLSRQNYFSLADGIKSLLAFA